MVSHFTHFILELSQAFCCSFNIGIGKYSLEIINLQIVKLKELNYNETTSALFIVFFISAYTVFLLQMNEIVISVMKEKHKFLNFIMYSYKGSFVLLLKHVVPCVWE